MKWVTRKRIHVAARAAFLYDSLYAHLQRQARGKITAGNGGTR